MLILLIDFAVPSVPQNVQVFSGVVVWGPPAESNGVITGYQLRFSGSSTRTVSKSPSESYHVVNVTDDNNIGKNIQVSVSILQLNSYLTSRNCFRYRQGHLLALDRTVLQYCTQASLYLQQCNVHTIQF